MRETDRHGRPDGTPAAPRVLFEELDRQATSVGEISLRRRWDPTLERELVEVKVDDEYLMSSLFTVVEEELAHRALARVPDAAGGLDVLVGGLGLGHTAHAALADDRVRRVDVVELSDAVISWHRDGLLPLGTALSDDQRCHLIAGDFFANVAPDAPLLEGGPGRYHALLLDIDHRPDHLLSERHGGFYRPDGLAVVRERLVPGGVFGMWADLEPDPAFAAVLDEVFAWSSAERVTFPNPYTGGESVGTVYLAGPD